MKRSARESSIEKPVCAYAKARGWLVWKLTVVGWVGLPDRIFLKPTKVFFIEFKAPGQKARPIQLRIHGKLRAIGFDVYVVDNVEEGKKIVDSY